MEHGNERPHNVLSHKERRARYLEIFHSSVDFIQADIRAGSKGAINDGLLLGEGMVVGLLCLYGSLV